MTTLEGRPNTDLLVIDVQQDVLADAYRRDGVRVKIETLLNEARSTGAPSAS